jgi:lysine-specific demethylase/histidyl-hydroxylase NO66
MYKYTVLVDTSDDESQGKCLAAEHSLHITISSYQLNSWTDLLEKLLPAALAVAAQDDPEFREVGCN